MQIIIGLIYLIFYTAFLIPREFNVRIPGMAFSLADVAFFVLLAAWIIDMTRRRAWKDLFSTVAPRLIAVFLGFLVLIAVLHWHEFGWGYKYFYIRYLYAFATIGIFLIGYSIPQQQAMPRMVTHLFFCYLVLSLVSIGYMEAPLLKQFYIDHYVNAKLMAKTIGYGMAYEGGYQLGIPRPMDLVGGFGNLVFPAVVFLPVFVALLPTLRQRIKPVFMYAALALMFVALFYLMSKATFIGLFVAFAVLLRYVKMHMRTVLAVGGVVLVLMLSSGVAQKTLYRFSVLPSDTSTGSRVVIYREAVKRIVSHPLAGIGLGGSMEDIKHPSIFSRVDIVDSLYLMPAMKFGLPGMLLLTGILAYLWRRGSRYLRSAAVNDHFDYRFVAGITAMLPGFFVAGLFAYPFSSISFDMVLWLLLGMFSRVVDRK